MLMLISIYRYIHKYISRYLYKYIHIFIFICIYISLLSNNVIHYRYVYFVEAKDTDIYPYLLKNNSIVILLRIAEHKFLFFDYDLEIYKLYLYKPYRFSVENASD